MCWWELRRAPSVTATLGSEASQERALNVSLTVFMQATCLNDSNI